MSKILKFLLDRLSEKSTWATIVTILSMIVGLELSPEQQDKITLAGLAVLGAIGVFVNENKTDRTGKQDRSDD